MTVSAIGRPKPWRLQKVLCLTLAALASVSAVLLTLTYWNLPVGESGYRQFLHRRPKSFRELYRTHSETLNADQQQVVDMTRHAWRGYRKFADWSDYLDVQSLKGGTVYYHDMALTAVDSLDTLFLMGLHDEFDEASAWVKANLSSVMFQEGTVSFFEVTIRSLGGLLSAFYLSGEQHFLSIAENLGAALQKGFTCGNGVPYHLVELEGNESYGKPFLSEVSTFQLEFEYLARATKNASFLDPVKHINNILIDVVKRRYPNGLIPVSMDWTKMQAEQGSIISMGAYGDSYYEYLLKQWLLTGKQDKQLREMYITAVDGMRAKLIGRSYPSKYAFVGKISVTGDLDAEMEHLTCFVPGMLALGYMHGMPTSHLDLAKELTETCAQMYLQSESHLAPEKAQFVTEPEGINQIGSELFVYPPKDFNILRPETIESLMILYRITGDEIYREYGRTIMAAFEKHCKIPAGGYRSTSNVWSGVPTDSKRGIMESFFISETLKYLFLLFSDNSILPLDEIVFNTEAHPFPIQ
ncbi:Endoplasmic reticulum mannosyl-oligosaccharide 1,2-alpha-mannosidase [Phytophthora boehmeriae]|uniref:mannosyl-oligosaccharide 1,2-alpha-mannosidase n=1 Tax=Phytophthora boehmeriae TaxID=109152 RepID=A0A8T1X001_9STRA|nr:Endoplasmic reticulum mannosyl-oligosaccharide 1,2-alpha-mannosidase [Phytophthora boehmeriae]